MRIVLDTLEKHGFKLNKDKCLFYKDEIEVLGNIISSSGIRPLPSRIEAINKAKMPTNKKELQSFLGFVNYCRRFIPELAIKASYLYQQINKDVKNDAYRNDYKFINTFNNVKNSIGKNVSLALPNLNEAFILTTDASNIGMGAVLSQNINGTERAIAFFSKVHNKAQQRYSTTEQELLAVVTAIEHFDQYLSHKRFLIKTDHKAIVYLLKNQNSKQRLFRWALSLQQYKFYIDHNKGDKNFSDLLSRAFDCTSVNVIRGSRKLKVPREEEISKIIEEAHIATGHGGEGPIKYLIAKKYIWNRMNYDVNNFIKNCESCQRAKKCKLQSYFVPVKAKKINEI